MDRILKDGKYLTFLATVDVGGNPHLRPLISLVSSGRIYFSTRDSSRKAKEMALNPAVEIVIPAIEEEKFSYLRVCGEALRIFEESIKNDLLKKFGYSLNEYLKVSEKDILLMYELLPTAVERFDSDEKISRDITREFFKKETEESEPQKKIQTADGTEKMEKKK